METIEILLSMLCVIFFLIFIVLFCAFINIERCLIDIKEKIGNEIKKPNDPKD